MRRIFILFFVVLGFLFQACDKEHSGDEYEISPSLPPYVDLSSGAALAAKEGTTVNVPIRLRTGLPQPVMVQYEITGAYATTGTVTIPKYTLQSNAAINIPAGVIPAGATTADLTFAIKSAMMETQALTVGHPGTNAGKRIIRVGK